MGNNGSRLIRGPTAGAWYENHPTRPSGKSLPILTIISWASEDGSLSQAIGWLKEAIPDKLRLKKLDQTVNRHIEDIVAGMVHFGVVRTEEGKVALAKKE